jgi:hypothetical protein
VTDVLEPPHDWAGDLTLGRTLANAVAPANEAWVVASRRRVVQGAAARRS